MNKKLWIGDKEYVLSEDVVKYVDQLRKNNSDLKTFLRHWGRHLEGCGWVSPLINGKYEKRWVGGCTCGFTNDKKKVKIE